MSLKFDCDKWNEQKNFLKHGVTNREAESIFDDPNKIVVKDEKHSLEEDRYICMGKANLEGCYIVPSPFGLAK